MLSDLASLSKAKPSLSRWPVGSIRNKGGFLPFEACRPTARSRKYQSFVGGSANRPDWPDPDAKFDQKGSLLRKNDSPVRSWLDEKGRHSALRVNAER